MSVSDSLDVEVDEAPPGPRWFWRHPALLSWLAVAVPVLLVQFFARKGSRGSVGDGLGRWVFGGWVHFDGPEYLQIAQQGYTARQVVWFPLYPTSIRAVTTVLRDPTLSAVLVSLVAGAAAAVLFFKWLELRVPTRTARLAALWVLLLYPYAWFLYGVVYSDALFLALVLGAFLLVEKDRFLLAGVVGAFATATRPSGFAVVAGLLVVALDRTGVLVAAQERLHPWWGRLGLPRRIDRSQLRPEPFLTLVALVGLLGYMTYLWVEWERPLRFVEEQANYHDPNAASLLKQQFFDAFYEGFAPSHLATTTFQCVLLTAVLLSVPAVGRRFGWGYGAYVLCLAAFPAVSVSTFMGVGRYLLPAFPVAALVGEWLSTRRRLAVVWFAVCGALVLVMSFGFSRNWYLT